DESSGIRGGIVQVGHPTIRMERPIFSSFIRGALPEIIDVRQCFSIPTQSTQCFCRDEIGLGHTGQNTISLSELRSHTYPRAIGKLREGYETAGFVITMAAFQIRGFASEISHKHVRCTPIEISWQVGIRDRKSTRLNSSHVKISYAVFC